MPNDKKDAQFYQIDKQALTIWSDGSYKVWGAMDAFYAQTDTDYLISIGLKEIIQMAEEDCTHHDNAKQTQIQNSEIPCQDGNFATGSG
jgi:hypothetical protein